MPYELPFILWGNIFNENNDWFVTTEASGFPKENAVDRMDWTYWKTNSNPTQDATVDRATAGVNCDTVAFLGHNLGSGGASGGATVKVQTSNARFFGGGVTTLATVTVLDDDPFYIDFSGGVRNTYIRILIENMNDATFIAVLWMGDRMEIPVGPGFSFDPDKQNAQGERYLNYEGGLIASNVNYSDRDMNVPFRRIPQTFIVSDLLIFLEDHYGEMKPFFFVPDPGDIFGTGKNKG